MYQPSLQQDLDVWLIVNFQVNPQAAVLIFDSFPKDQ